MSMYIMEERKEEGMGGGRREREREWLNTLSLSSWLVSRAHERYQVSLFFSLASLSYFSSVLLSTCPVKNLKLYNQDVTTLSCNMYATNTIKHSTHARDVDSSANREAVN